MLGGLLRLCLVAYPRTAPLGHRTYTYQAKPFAAFTRFNAAASAAGTPPVSVVNAYGGWFTSEVRGRTQVRSFLSM